MKLIIINLLLTISSCFSEKSDLMIITYPTLVNFYRLDENMWEDPFSSMSDLQRQSLCKSINKAQIFVASRIFDPNNANKSDGKFPYRRYEYLYNQITSVTQEDNYAKVQKKNLFSSYSDPEKVAVLSCTIRKVTAYILKHANCADYLLFGKNLNEAEPRILAVIAPYIMIDDIMDSSLEIETSYKEIEAQVPSPTEAQMKLFSRKGYENFQLCVSLMKITPQFNICSHSQCSVTIYHSVDGQYSKKIFSARTVSNQSTTVEAFALVCEMNNVRRLLPYTYHIIPYRLNEKELFVVLNYNSNQKALKHVHVKQKPTLEPI